MDDTMCEVDGFVWFFSSPVRVVFVNMLSCSLKQ